MSYTKQTFVDGQVLTASDLNSMSEGIAEALAYTSSINGEANNDLVIIDQNYENLTFLPKTSVNSNGSTSAMDTYNSYSFVTEKDGILYFSDIEPTMHNYLALGHIPNGATTGSRYRKSESTLPTKDAPLTVTAGDTIIITIPTVDLLLSLYTTSISTATTADVLKAIDDNGLIVQHIYCGDDCGQGLMILKKCGNHSNLFLGQLYSRVVKSSINSNTWRLSYLIVMERVGNCFSICREPIVYCNHEWECAIQEEGAADFCGGTAHGDENMVTMVALLDGKKLDLSSSFIITGRCLEALEQSILNRCDTPGENIMNHFKKYIITPEELKVNQTLEFIETINIVSSYLEMCPVQRAYTPYAYIEGNLAVNDVSTSEHNRPSITGHNGTFMEWGDNFSIRLKIESDANYDGGYIFISNSDSPAYNKIYYSIAGTGPTTIDAGTKITVTNTYNYNYNE